MTNNNELSMDCPDCDSDDTTWSNKKQMFKCENCNYSWVSFSDSTERSDADFCIGLANSDLWQQSVLNKWPAPISHEYQQLRTVLDSGLLIAAIFQLKDVIEVTVKVTAITMYQWLQVTTPDLEEMQEVRKSLFIKQLSLGSWLQLMRTVAELILNNDTANHGLGRQLATWILIPVAPRGVAGAKPKPKMTDALKLLDSMVSWRNDEIGHGALRLKTDDLWDPFTEKLEKLHQVMLDSNPWQDTTLYIIDTKNTQPEAKPLVGWQSIKQRHNQLTPIEIDQHQTNTQDIYISYINSADPDSQTTTVPLSPYIQGHTCKDCSLQDIFIYDSHNQERFYHLDYLSGHRIRLDGHQVPALKKELYEAYLQLVDDNDTNLQQPALNQNIVKLLEEKSLEASYLPPIYLHKAFSDFMKTHDNGIFWLQAPAHIGKSIFVHNISKKYEKSPLPDDLITVKFHIRREFRYFAHHFIESLTGQLKTAFNLTSGTEKLPEIDLSEGKLALVNWLNNWWRISRKSDAYRLLIAIDGLDEIGEPERTKNGIQTSILDILPSNPELEQLDDGIYLLLTSREVADCPSWMQDKIEKKLIDITTLNITLKHRDYRGLLQQYFEYHLEKRLKHLSKEEEDKLFKTLLEKSESQFLYFSLLVGLIKEQQLNQAKLQKLPSGEALYAHYIRNLEHLLGKDSKQFKRIQDLLTLLTACEQAAVADARIQDKAMNAFTNSDTATGSKEEVGNLYWEGLDLATIAGLLEEPDGIWSSQLIFTLYSLKSLIKVERSSQQAHYRLGLKELSSFINTYWKEEVAQWHYRLSVPFYHTWKDCWDNLNTDITENHYQLRYLLSHAWIVKNNAKDKSYNKVSNNHLSFFKLIINNKLLIDNYFKIFKYFEVNALNNNALVWVNMFMYFIISDYYEIKDAHWQNDLSIALECRCNIFKSKGDITEALADCDQAIKLKEDLVDQMAPSGNYPVNWLNDLASTFSNRARIYSSKGDMTAAMGDYNLAIKMRISVYKESHLRDNYSLEFLNDFTSTVTGRAVLYSDLGNMTAAMDDFNQAIGACEPLYEHMNINGNCELKWQENLAFALSGRAVIYSLRNDMKAAIDDYSQSIKLKIGLLDQMIVSGNNEVKLQSNLATSLTNRGNIYSQKGDIAAALTDYDQAVALQLSLYHQMDISGDYEPQRLESLATSLSNRGLFHFEQGDIEAALRDYNQAIELEVILQKQMNTSNKYSPQSQNNLAGTLVNRAVLYGRMGNKIAELNDYDHAINLGLDLQEQMNASGIYMPHWNHTLAATLGNRASIYSDQGDIEAALTDYNRAIKLEEILYDEMYANDNYPPQWQYDFSKTLFNRANLHSDQGDIEAALTDYNQAIKLEEILYAQMYANDNYIPQWLYDFSKTLFNRANLYNDQGDIKAALSDYSKAIKLGVGLREDAIDSGSYTLTWQNKLACILNSRANLYQLQGNIEAALADFNGAAMFGLDIMQRLYLSDDYPPDWQNQLTIILMGRANIYNTQGNIDAALTDFDNAVMFGSVMMQKLYLSGDYLPDWQNQLTVVLVGRANTYNTQGNIDAALDDYNQASELATRLRQDMNNSGNYPTNWQYNLAAILVKKIVLYLKKSNTEEALTDLNYAFYLLYDLVIEKAIQAYLSNLIKLQIFWCIKIDGNEVYNQAENLVIDIESTYPVAQLTADEYQALTELKSQLRLK